MTFKPGKNYKVRFIGDAALEATIEVKKRSSKFVTILFDGEEKRVKIYVDDQGAEFIYPEGKYSQAPIARAKSVIDERETLTNQNAHKASVIEHPEYGRYPLLKDANGWIIGRGASSRHISPNEFSFWKIDSYKEEIKEEESLFGEIISEYSVEQGIEDGILADLDSLTDEGETFRKSAGIKHKVAISQGIVSDVFDRCPANQDPKGRLWDILTMFKYGVKRLAGGESSFDFTVLMRVGRSQRYQIRAGIGPMSSKNLTPVITLSRPDED